MPLDVMQYAPSYGNAGYQAATGPDPWLQQAFDYYMSNVGPKRTKKIGSYQGDLQSKLNYALGLGHDDELALYNTWLQNNPKPAATPTTAAAAPTPASQQPVDPAKVAAARQAALDQAELDLRAQGLDPALYMPAIQAQYDRVGATADPTKDPYSIYSPAVAQQVVQAENAKRNQAFMQDFESKFGYAADRAALPSTMLDDAINQILTEQQSAAQTQLERGKERGIYNDVGYQAGQSALANQSSAARAELGYLGSGIIDKYMGGLNDIDSRAFDAYQSFPMGSSSFSLDPYMQERSDYIANKQANAAGELRGTLGGKNFFDFGKIGQQAGTAQGALNLRDADVATALAERKRLNTQSRGLGSQGAF